MEVMTSMVVTCRPDKSLSEASHSWLWPPLSNPPQAQADASDLQTSRLAHIFAKLSLGTPSAALRRAACNVIQGLWWFFLLHGKRKQSAAVLLIQTLLGWLPYLAAYGTAATEAGQLMTSLLEGPAHEQLRSKAPPAESAEDQASKKAKNGKNMGPPSYMSCSHVLAVQCSVRRPVAAWSKVAFPATSSLAVKLASSAAKAAWSTALLNDSEKTWDMQVRCA